MFPISAAPTTVPAKRERRAISVDTSTLIRDKRSRKSVAFGLMNSKQGRRPQKVDAIGVVQRSIPVEPESATRNRRQPDDSIGAVVETREDLLSRMIDENAKLADTIAEYDVQLWKREDDLTDSLKKAFKAKLKNEKLIAQNKSKAMEIDHLRGLVAEQMERCPVEDLVCLKSPEMDQNQPSTSTGGFTNVRLHPQRQAKRSNRASEVSDLSNISASSLTPDQEAALLESPAEQIPQSAVLLDTFSGSIPFKEKVSTFNTYFTAF